MSQAFIDPIFAEALTSDSVGENNCQALADEIAGIPKRKKPKLTIMQFDKVKYELVGRKLVCLLDPFGSPTTAISVGLKVDSGREGDIDMVLDAMMQQFRFYQAILTHSRGLEEEMARINAKELRHICGWITAGMGNQRLIDLVSVQHHGLAYVLRDGGAFDPPISKGEDKSMRGFNNPQIARLLCPRKKLDAFDEDPDTVIVALREGLINTSASNWPTCFYAEDVYDQENELKGLFCSLAAFRFYTHLFIEPSAAATSTATGSSSKMSKNHAWGLTEVTPYIIAYIHVLMYFTLSTAPRWCAVIGQMDLSELLWLIIEMFDDKDDWTRETLSWWNTRAFPQGHATLDSDDDTNVIRAQRAGKAKCPSAALEHSPAQAIEFMSPLPAGCEPKVLTSLSTGAIRPRHAGKAKRPAVETIEPMSPLPVGCGPEVSTSISLSSTFNTIAAQESDLPSCTSDYEDRSLVLKTANDKKDLAWTRTTKPRRRTTKKRDGF